MPKSIDVLVNTVKNQSILLSNYADHVEHRTAEMRKDLNALAESSAEQFDNSNELADMSGVELQTKVLDYIDSEIAHIAAFDAARKQPDAKPLSFQISTHKLSYTLPKIRAQLTGEENESAVVKLASGSFEPDQSFYDKYPILRTDSFFGSNRATYTAGKMLCVKFATSAATIADYKFTSIAHVSPWPTLPECFVNSESKFFAMHNGMPGFGFYHGGYAFGGQRGESYQCTWGPEDCSSLLGNLIYQSSRPNNVYCAAPIQASTVHQLYAWRARQGNDKMFIDPDVDGYSVGMVKYWDAILENATPSADTVKPGDIYLLRTAMKVKGDFDSHATGGGHTGVVIGEDPSNPNNVLIFECGRDLEQENINLEQPEKSVWGVGGAGIGSFSKRYEEKTDDRIKRNMFLRPKPSFSL